MERSRVRPRRTPISSAGPAAGAIRKPRATSWIFARRPPLPSRRSYLDETLHADARHETVSPPLLQSGVRQRQLRRFLALGPGDLVIDLGCGSGRSMLWNAPSGAAFTGADVSPFFAEEARRSADLTLADLRQLPFRDAAFTKAYALDVLEHLSPESLDGMLREAARVLQPGGRLFVYSHVRKNAPIAGGLRAINALARQLERLGLLDMTQERLRKSDHLNPLMDIPHLEAVVARAGFRLARIRYYTPLVGGFIENILVRMAERQLARRAARRGSEAGSGKDAYAAAARRADVGQGATRAGRPDPRGARGAHPRHGHRPRALRPHPVGPVLRTSREGAACGPTRARARRSLARGRRGSFVMRILYVAIDQTVPGTKGGSTHVEGVARGLAALGHELHVTVARGTGPFDPGRVIWHDVGAPLGRPHLRLLRVGAIRRLVERVRPDVVMERYHNFGGEGLLAARRAGLTTVLEVNAPVVDYQGSPKRVVDRALVEPMRRWRDWQCRTADLIVTPISEHSAGLGRPRARARGRMGHRHQTLPAGRARAGALPPRRGDADCDLRRCVPRVAWRRHVRRRAGDTRSARPALARRAHRRRPGDGPRARPGTTARRAPSHDCGALLPYSEMPAALAAADVGVAPFDVERHAPLRELFFWSPLKVFEYLASGLPVVAPDLPRLRALIGAGDGGVLYDPNAPTGLADALDSLVEPATRGLLSARARSRAERLYSWDAHCRTLAAAIERARKGVGSRAD